MAGGELNEHNLSKCIQNSDNKLVIFQSLVCKLMVNYYLLISIPAFQSLPFHSFHLDFGKHTVFGDRTLCCLIWEYLTEEDISSTGAPQMQYKHTVSTRQ